MAQFRVSENRQTATINQLLSAQQFICHWRNNHLLLKHKIYINIFQHNKIFTVSINILQHNKICMVSINIFQHNKICMVSINIFQHNKICMVSINIFQHNKICMVSINIFQYNTCKVLLRTTYFLWSSYWWYWIPGLKQYKYDMRPNGKPFLQTDSYFLISIIQLPGGPK
jgi:hypothetical protein